MIKQRNSEKRAEAFKLRLAGHTYASAGRILHLSRQRVQQLTGPSLVTLNFVCDRASWKCQCCGRKLAKSGHIHHQNVVGLSSESYNAAANLRYLCASCHKRSHRVSDSEVSLKVYPLRLKPETVEGLTEIAKAKQMPWSTYLRSLAEGHVKVCKGHACEMMYSKKQVEAVNPGARMTIRDTVRREGR